MSLLEIKQALKHKLASTYEAIELNSIIAMLIEHVTGWDTLKQAMRKSDEIDETQALTINELADELITGKPIQYILGKTWFMDNEFIVNKNVLIPRPETEELVDWVIEYANIIQKPLKIIDIGTGSGCIAISLDKLLPNCTVTALDISEAALEVAKSNAVALHANIEWIQEDILKSNSLPECYDIIVSNPPYIPFRETANMQVQVKKYEPSIALFVTNEDPLIFYKAIGRLGEKYLAPKGQLFFEIHHDQRKAILALFDEMGYHAEIRQDMYGKDRMLRASLKTSN